MSYNCPNRNEQAEWQQGGHEGRGGRKGQLRVNRGVKFGVTFMIMTELNDILNDNWILLDMASTDNIFCNEDMVKT